MILRSLRLALLLEVILTYSASYYSAFTFPGDYQSIKDVLRFAKSDPKLIDHARIIAQDYTAQNSIQNLKEAMCCVSIFKLADDTGNALKVLENMKSRNLAVDTYLYNNVISVCSKTSDWRLAIELLLMMQNNGVSSDTISFSSAISACAKSGRWRESLNLLNEMSIAGIVADTICYSSAISACASAGCWKEALLLISDMKSKKVPLDTIVCNSAISACVPSGEWTVALRLMDLMKTEGITPSAYTYAVAMSACDSGGQCDEVLRLLERLLIVMTPRQSPESVEGRHEKSTSSYQRPVYFDVRSATVPFNIAIAATAKCGRIMRAKEIFDKMGELGVHRNTITFTTLIIGISKSRNFDQRMVLEVHQIMMESKMARNGAIFGAVISAAESIEDWELTLDLLRQMKSEGVATSSFVYHSAISACGKAGRLDKCIELLEEMKERKVERTTVTYSLLMNACRRSGEWERALQFLVDIEQDFKEVPPENGNMLSIREALRPDTIVYSTAISVCVGSQQWGRALELLERMEELDITRNVVSYNTVIEALSNAGETARAELVYQSALRTGVYNHWHRSSQHHGAQKDRKRISKDLVGSSEIMDLHNFPLAVAKVAVMLVLGEMCAGSIAVADPLIIITGRGNHESSNGLRGVLKREILEFCGNLGLIVQSGESIESLKLRPKINGKNFESKLPGKMKNPIEEHDKADSAEFKSQTSSNPGRLWLSKESTLNWLDAQRKEHEQLRCTRSNGVHGNLFLKVAMAQRKLSEIESEIPLNVRAVCPFSTATHESLVLPLSGVESLRKVALQASGVAAAAAAEGSKGSISSEVKRCPMHATTPTSTPEISIEKDASLALQKSEHVETAPTSMDR